MLKVKSQINFKMSPNNKSVGEENKYEFKTEMKTKVKVKPDKESKTESESNKKKHLN